MRKVLISLLFLATPATAASPVAEILCDASDRMQARLTRTMGVERQAMGIQGPEQVMELWTRQDGSWTLVVTYASGTSCIVAMGEDWQAFGRDPA
ncbi:signal peptide protein [Oceanicola sp. 22II-s10i]|uniref:hypothetical protein n=1 Tax=Oceanicola sp. 22II-s10i TaxID=1317116 RepID=UPI000B51EC33|nr:hypothetical protein [Oceanicola sp. 22II-s10i]OWU85362.1 signal peptide protein [Oceanicola sp. 22II-s10i]